VGVYRCHGCRRRVSVTSGTIFDKTRVPLTTWFEAIWLFTSSKAGVSAANLHRVLPISSYQTAWTMLGKLRAVLGSDTAGEQWLALRGYSQDERKWGHGLIFVGAPTASP